MNGPAGGDKASGDDASEDDASDDDGGDSRPAAVADAVRRLLASCRQLPIGIVPPATAVPAVVVAMRTLPDGVARLAWATAAGRDLRSGCPCPGRGGRPGRA